MSISMFEVNKISEYFGKIKHVIRSNSDFFLLWISQVFTESAVSILGSIIGILSDEGVISESTKNSATGIGLILFLATFPGLFLGPIAGVFSDWFPKKKIMITTNVIRFFIVLLFVFVHGWENLILSYSLIFVLSIFLQFFIPAAGGLISQIASKKYLLLANSLFSLTVYGAMGIGFSLGGLFLNVLGVQGTFILCASFYIASTLLLLLIKKKPLVRKRVSFDDVVMFFKKLISDVKEGFKYAFQKKIVRFALVHLFLLQIAGMTLVTIIFRIGDEIYGVSPRTAGVVVISPLLVGLVVSMAILNTVAKHKNRIQLLWYGTILSIVGFSFMGIISVSRSFLNTYFLEQAVSTLSLIAVGGAMPFLIIPGQTIIHENTQASFKGRILGIWLALTSSLASIIASGVGYGTDQFNNISFAILLLVFIDIIYSIVIYLLSKKSFDD